MNINIRLNKNFTTAFNKMQEAYGEELSKINGFSDMQLSYTDFIDNFVDSDTVADASVDGNANVGQKDIVTLINEMPKPHQKLLAFNKIYYEINKKYGFKTANDWLKNEWDGHLYLHDANTSSFVHYCYKGEETLTVKYKDVIYYTSFKNLYDLVEEKEEVDRLGNNYKRTDNLLFVLDCNDNGNVMWTEILCVSKMPNNKTMRFIKFANGLSQIVTDDHPVITSIGEVPAKKLTTEHQVFTIQPFGFEKPEEDNIYNKDFGWLVGMALAEGSAQPSCITIKQTEEKQYQRLIYTLNKLGMPFSLDTDRRIRIKSSPLEKIIENMLLNKTAAFKQLPSNYMRLPTVFMDGVVAGLIDGDGTIDGYKNRHCQIRIASELLCHQISSYLQYKGIFCGDRTPHIYHSEKSFSQKLPLFGIGFTLTNEEYFLNIDSIKINEKYEPLIRKGNFKNKKYIYDYGWVPVIENSVYIEECPVVYDITTTSHHFICNNILSHNCFAYDLKNLAEKGLFFIDTFNAEPPQHLETFVDFVKEFVSWTCNRSSGAVGLPNLIPYMYYFWKKDCASGLFTDNTKYAKQQIQRLIYALNQPFLRGGIQSAFTNTSVFDRPYLEALFGGAEFPDDSFMIDEIEGIMDFQKIYLETMSEIRSKNMMTFPVNTISLLKQNGKFVDEEFAKYAIKHNMKWNDSNIFADSSVNSLSNCCRLKSNIEDLGYFNSIGGTALKVGSVKVGTINLARLALENKTEKEYLVALKELVELDLKCLDRVRYIIKRNVDKKLLKNFSYEIVDFEHLYNTIGFIGIYETMKTFGYTRMDEFGNTYYTEEAEKFGKKIFDVIHNVKDTFALDKDYTINCEQIPGETAAAKLMKKDMFFYPDTAINDLPLYGNQFIPLGIKTTLQERIRIAAIFDGFCNGGSILHVNIESPFTSFEQAWDMLNYITDQGVTYFAFNTKIQACKHNHAFFGTVCPECGEPVDTEYTRIVGFYTPVKTYSKERKAEYDMREWENINE